MKQAVQLSAKGIAIGDFAFRDGPALGLSAGEAYETAKRLSEHWDGSETLLEIYKRTEQWPDVVEGVPA